MRKFLLLFSSLLICASFEANAQARVVEISWMDYEYTQYQGVIVMYANNKGMVYSRFYNPMVGTVYVSQQATLTNTYDYFGNCTSFINCSYPDTTPYVPYSADNFAFFPDGSVYTQDYSGKWSTVVQYRIVPEYDWGNVIDSYSL